MRSIRAAALAATLAAAASSPAAAASEADVAGPGGHAATQQSGSGAAVQQLSQDAILAQQLGYLAADKRVEAEVALLADKIALLNAELTRRLAQGTDSAVAMSPAGQALFDSVDDLNKDDFTREFTRIIAQTYPRMIDRLEQLASSREGPLQQVAEETLPVMKDQLVAVERLSQGESAGLPDQGERRGPIQRKDDPEVIPPHSGAGER